MKEQLRDLLLKKDYEEIVRQAGHTNRVLSFLTALTYDNDPLIAWQAIEAIGLAAAHIADSDSEVVRIHLRRMLWLLNDESGGIGWRLPEAMAEIIYHRPQYFAEFVQIVIALFDMEAEDLVHFKAGILWAIGRLAQVIPDSLGEAFPWIIPCLNDPDPQTRGMAGWCLGQLGQTQHLAQHKTLLADDSPVEFYSEGQLTRRSVGELVWEALAVKATRG